MWLLHKALEAAQLEKRTCTEFLAAECEQERLELLRHRERQAADLQGRLEELKVEAEGLRASLAQRDTHVAELKENVTLMMAKNNSKQEVKPIFGVWSRSHKESHRRSADTGSV